MEVRVRLAGAAGQGVQTAADLLGLAVTRSGRFAYGYTDAESRIRGGLNFTQMRLADRPLEGVVEDYEVLVALSKESLEAYGGREGAVVVGAENWGHPRAAPFFLTDIAAQAGAKAAAGTVGVAAVCCWLGLDQGPVAEAVAQHFAGREKLIEINRRAVAVGYEAASAWTDGAGFKLPDGDASAERLWLAGHQALSLGAVAGGVTFMAAYPMSPSTAIITNLSAWGAEAGIVTEQAEDEVAAINMVAGAAYAGARAMTATSGGGLCLMMEGVSLLGCIEAPAVIALAQRPGPATGLATRTAQGDLGLVRFAGHGFFPRIILAPQDVADNFALTAQAFDLAERFQVPVFILTDQLLQDSTATVDPFIADDLPTSRYYLTRDELEARETYGRYELTDTGVSPLAAPGVSTKLIVADSHVHDEAGHYTEDQGVADRMAQKRLAKNRTVLEAVWAPEVEGRVEGNALVLSWGSSYASLAEALDLLAEETGTRPAHLHLRWLWPLSEDMVAPLAQGATKIIAVENSVGGYLADLWRELTLRPVDALITRHDGRPLSVSELVDRLRREVAP
ncbi:MAG: 2-oxoacid:acceptor oxidoreductase subunit alpha [Proteobacteria bacterium]|nr:2-oxoacid:acceptor oxidoreductase subunit alpha [Pseudomonadota bacterium]MBU1739917.1 2-oxoacid:acceptor oxidoreductase subunit alpha [Pseudomonadota bacterium]